MNDDEVVVLLREKTNEPLSVHGVYRNMAAFDFALARIDVDSPYPLERFGAALWVIGPKTDGHYGPDATHYTAYLAKIQ